MPPNQTVFEKQMEELRADMRGMRATMGQIAQALTKLSILEERNLSMNQSVEKLDTRQEKIEAKMALIELEQVRANATVDGATKTVKVMWAVVGGGVLFLGSQIIQRFV